MKLQGFSVIFTLVCIPLLLVLGYYISLQVDTITLQNQYDTKLLDATYDAMSSFEINTANEDLSSVSDSLRTIIEASNNIFFNTLATNMGLSNASKSYIEPYIPSVLYTLYDGYYIFAPTSIPVVKTNDSGVALAAGMDGVKWNKGGSYYEYSDVDADNDGTLDVNPATLDFEDEYLGNKIDYGQLLYETTHDNQYTTNVNDAKLKISNVLKSYMPYSARYRASNKAPRSTGGINCVFSGNVNYDITVVYTLDNFITVDGYFETGGANSRIYYTESGYLLKGNDENVDVVLHNSTGDISVVNNNGIARYNQNEVQNIIDNLYGSDNCAIVTIRDDRTRNGDNTTTISTEEIDDLNDDYIHNHRELYPIFNPDVADPADAFDQNEERLKELLVNSDRWNEKSLREKYEVLLTILKNRYNEIEDVDLSTVDQTYKDRRLNKLRVLNRFMNEVQETLDTMSSVAYYAKAKIFTSWVNSHLSMVQANDLVQISGIDYATIQESIEGTRDFSDDSMNNLKDQLDFKNDESYIFDVDAFDGEGALGENDNSGRSKLNEDSATEISDESVFYNHKLRVIRSSIQYSLNLAMSTYNSNEAYGSLGNNVLNKGGGTLHQAYAMPVIKFEEWEKITDNPSIVAFMQGLKCGLKIYNNYAIVSSTNNEVMVHPEQIYYVAYNRDNYEAVNSGGLRDVDSFYHRIDCGGLLSDCSSITNLGIRSFSSKEVKYDKIYDKTAVQSRPYKYDHKNLACYACINDGNYIGDDYVDVFNSAVSPQYLREAFYSAVGKERNNVYKMNAFSKSDGYQKVYSRSNAILTTASALTIKEIKAIRIVFGFVSGEGSESLNFKVTSSSGTNRSIFFFCR